MFCWSVRHLTFQPSLESCCWNRAFFRRAMMMPNTVSGSYDPNQWGVSFTFQKTTGYVCLPELIRLRNRGLNVVLSTVLPYSLDLHQKVLWNVFRLVEFWYCISGASLSSRLFFLSLSIQMHVNWREVHLSLSEQHYSCNWRHPLSIEISGGLSNVSWVLSSGLCLIYLLVMVCFLVHVQRMTVSLQSGFTMAFYLPGKCPLLVKAFNIRACNLYPYTLSCTKPPNSDC